MKKIIAFTILLIFIPFFIVYQMDNNPLEEIELKYINNINIRVKRLKTNEIQNIPLEEYVVGVLAGEMPTSFNIEALKAQAVASRTYALKRMEYSKEDDYDVVDSVLNQVYLDDNYLKSVWDDNYIINVNKLRTAVNSTIDEYLDYNGDIVEALFFSTSNGYTENSELVFDFAVPYLTSVNSEWDKTSAAFSSSDNFSLQEFYDKLNLKYNPNLEIKNIVRSNTNRVLKLDINGVTFTGRNLYEILSLRSTDFEINKVNSNVIINMKGYGHGVGMSQCGANGMANDGYGYVDILKHYYLGVEIKKIQN